MDTTQHQPQQHPRQIEHFPPSPPPSPTAARRRQNKKRDADPFFDLGSASVPILAPSPPSSPTQQPDEPQEHILVRLIWTPLLFTSFLLSLFLVNRSDRSRRYTSSSRSSTLFARLNPEPYQDSTNTTWDRRGSTSHVEPHDAISPGQSQPQKKRSWYLRKKIRKMARLEIGDALEMRNRVIVVMVGVALGLAYVGWMALHWVVGMVWR